MKSDLMKLIDFINKQQELMEEMESEPDIYDKGVCVNMWNGMQSVREEINRIMNGDKQ